MSGATLFNLPFSISPPPPWYLSNSTTSLPTAQLITQPQLIYSKSETLSHDSNSKDFNQFNYVLTSNHEKFNIKGGEWVVIDMIEGFGGYGLSLKKGIVVKMKDEVWILKRVI